MEDKAGYSTSKEEMSTKQVIKRKRVGRYSDQIRQQAAIEYAISGSLTQVEKQLDIPHQTLSEWKGTEWWDTLIGKVRHENDQRHISTYTRIVDEAHKITLEKLPEATAAQANIIAATATDKARLLMNQPTSITGKGQSMEDMALVFAKISQAAIKQELKDKELITVIEHKDESH